jgi:hypothetical protein
MIQGCERRSWPRCRPSTTAAWRFVRPAVETPSVGSRSLVYRLGVPSPQVRPLVAVLQRPQPLGQGQRGCKQRLRPRWHRGGGVRGREATPVALHRWVACIGPPRSVRGLLVGPRRPTPRPRARRGASVLWSRRHHHHRSRHHHHLGEISHRGTTSSNNNISSSSNNNNNNNNRSSSGRPASRVARKSRAPSKCGPFLHESNYHVDRS